MSEQPTALEMARRAGLLVYQVGQPYNPEAELPIEQTPHLRITGPNLELAIAYTDPRPEEIQDFTYGQVRFAWVDSEQVAMFAFKLGTMPWADCPFHARFIVEAGWEPPRLEPDGGALLPMIFINATNGLVVGIRLIGLPETFVAAMATTVSRQLLMPYDVAAHDAALNALYGRYATPAAMVRERADVTCIGADPDSTLPGTGPDAN